MTPIILASNSPYRRELLNKLRLSYRTQSPQIDESPYMNELAPALANRLAQAKAQKVALDHPEALIIGSDQTAQLNARILGKPNNHENALIQLRECQGQTVTFYTAITLINTKTSSMQSHTDAFRVTFRTLSDRQLEFYLQAEQPYDCAGSFKCEGLGITLFEKLEGRDPNSLIGLPLIALTKLLLNEGIDVLGSSS